MTGLRIRNAEIILASHHAFANRVALANPGTPVLSYTHTPARWLWQAEMRRGEPGGRVGAALLGAFAAAHRRSDVRAAHAVRRILANSSAVAERVNRYWGLPADVVHPPVDTEYYTCEPSHGREEFFLSVGRLVPYKRPDLTVALATRLGLPLVVVGEGRLRSQLEAAAGPSVRFRGAVEKDELRRLFRSCRALLMPGEEDFGIVPAEAQACGAPVIALAAGGALDIVDPGRSGLLVHSDRLEDWVDAVHRLDDLVFDDCQIRCNAERFGTATFRRRIRQAVDDTLGQHSKSCDLA
jgi:glycosyltransferase involved in cell wall biosynthesis